ncbi:tRNA (adenosine(37)-N6)-threonylcarbamoyltransferase complex transferase subunit TsaD [Rubrobacter tropicus]|uniref:tRNA N6-adenosine threonylcarbamoyltransferase n=1 Tax=Rubrobacter tropicus TaxID=2653851 RepID=A0A6G8Q780_9ACTN|nr:tRNA (adenosine(37)-N6)-threonylcarbamoyltransferase complex transferase subunit TsaD [Rubrobacter tropicus]QIN82303.1 tRNA (adenosine(37)-N6)-threonylcarbamoyltransferase complex transferase subunit TsaD [Rubrobacter tropicus]
MILAIETSCDDTCAAVIRPDGRKALSNVVHTQTEHARYGGVVPEVASRAHLERLDGVIEKALADAGTDLEGITGVAVTVRPGLIGALLVGVAAAKGIAYARRLPLVPVNHLEGHVAAAYLAQPDLEPPFVALIASGGHTALYSVNGEGMSLLGETLDDAAGEALDKGARMLGLGFPGGPEISRAAANGDPARHEFPVGLRDKNNLDFSFSGLKTSLLYKLKALDEDGAREELPHLAAGYEHAVVEALSRKLLRAAEAGDAQTVVVAGGVAANGLLRRTLEEECGRRGLRLVIPPPGLCTDNAAMIGAAAPLSRAVPFPEYLTLNARSV